MSSIDFEKFNETVHLSDVAKALGLDHGRFNALWLRTSCPVCAHADPRCCHVKWERNLWYCHRCKRGGGAIQLAALVLRVDPYLAVMTVCRKLGIAIPWKPRVRTRRRQRDRTGEIISDTDEDDVIDC